MFIIYNEILYGNYILYTVICTWFLAGEKLIGFHPASHPAGGSGNLGDDRLWLIYINNYNIL